MTLDELRNYVVNAQWFDKLGTFPESPETLVIRTLEPPEEDEEWDWLPSTITQEDPIYDPPLNVIAEGLGLRDELRVRSKEYYALALRSLRKLPDELPLLIVGPENATPAARGAALYAVKQCVAEIVIGAPGFWSSLIPIYSAGYWPCGITDERHLVVL